jgi:hypothetical protein
MKPTESYWQDLIKQYESSGLSQEDFCRARLIPLTKFKYRWRRQMELGNGVKSLETSSKGALSRFEDVSIIEAKPSPGSVEKSRGISIQFPNQIRAELNITVSCPEFGVLLKQLVALC